MKCLYFHDNPADSKLSHGLIVYWVLIKRCSGEIIYIEFSSSLSVEVHIFELFTFESICVTLFDSHLREHLFLPLVASLVNWRDWIDRGVSIPSYPHLQINLFRATHV